MSTDDHRLLTRAASGDASALEILMTRYSARVYRLAYGITRSVSDAEEVVQDVFLQLVYKGAGFEGRAALGSWIYRIATNLSFTSGAASARSWSEMPDEMQARLRQFLADKLRD